MLHSPFAAKLSIMSNAGGCGGPELMSRNTSLRAYGAIKQAEEPADLAQSILWSPAKELAEARERMTWHELMSRRNIESSEILQVGCWLPAFSADTKSFLRCDVQRKSNLTLREPVLGPVIKRVLLCCIIYCLFPCNGN